MVHVQENFCHFFHIFSTVVDEKDALVGKKVDTFFVHFSTQSKLVSKKWIIFHYYLAFTFLELTYEHHIKSLTLAQDKKWLKMVTMTLF